MMKAIVAVSGVGWLKDLFNIDLNAANFVNSKNEAINTLQNTIDNRKIQFFFN